jgi:hypothetical protein
VLVTCWSAKGGVGTTVVATALAVLAARRHGAALLVDLAGDVAPLVGADSSGPGLADWAAVDHDLPIDATTRLEHALGPDGLSLLPAGGILPDRPDRLAALAAVLSADSRPVVVDAGCVRPGWPGEPLARSADRSLLVTRPCYLALRRMADVPLRPHGVVVVREPGRALDAGDVAEATGAAVVAEVLQDPAVARAADAGLLLSRLPRTLARPLAAVWS